MSEPGPNALARATWRWRLKPDYVILGARCGGTTSLHHYLCAHPQVAPPLTKEIHFFDDHFNRGEPWYRAHFAPAAERAAAEAAGRRLITGEASPAYLYHPHVPNRLHVLLPEARLLVLLRHPVDRAFSHYQQIRREGAEPLGFEAALEAEGERLDRETQRLLAGESADWNALKRWSYQARGDYAQQLDRWFAVVPRERLLILGSEALFSDPEEAMRRVWTFLDLPHHALPRYRAHHAGRYEEALPASVRRRLLARFAGPNERLYEMLGERFAWDD